MKGYATPAPDVVQACPARHRGRLRSPRVRSNLVAVASVVPGLLGLFTEEAVADSVNDLAQVCSGCHGEKGVPMDKSIPVIWGQRREYLLKQLWDFKIGHRKNEIMAGIVESLSKTDMEALASYFSEQKWPKLDQQPAPPDVAHEAQQVISTLNCRGCHQDNFEGDYVRPSLRGQQQDYLLKTMTDFHTGARSNFPAMMALMKSLDENQLKPLAAYLAGLSPEIPSAMR